MVGHRVILMTNDGYPSAGHYDGVLHKLDATGATIFISTGFARDDKTLFVPMPRIKEIQDKGRAP